MSEDTEVNDAKASNPYAEPSAPLDRPEEVRAPLPRARLIPALVLGVLGVAAGLGFVVNAGLIVAITWQAQSGGGVARYIAERYEPTPANITGVLGYLAGCVFGLLGSKAWLRGRWRRAVALTSGLIASAAVILWVHPFG